jgi:hypothetical protein
VYFAGETQISLSYTFRIANNTISTIIPETCWAIFQSLREQYVRTPETREEWMEQVTGFMNDWQYPNCFGAIDGKHVKIMKPTGSGSEFFNYKGFFSVVLLGMVNSCYQFTYVDIGTNGRVSDGGVWGKSKLKSAIESESHNLPKESFRLPGSNRETPLVAVVDEAFGLKNYLMRPFPGQLSDQQRIYNYRFGSITKLETSTIPSKSF